MTDEQDTKKFEDRKLERLENKLLQGTATATEMQQALGEIVGHVRILVGRNTVTEEDCIARRDGCAAAREQAEKTKKAKDGETAVNPADPAKSIGTAMLRDVIRWVPTPVLFFLYVVGKGKGWW